MFKNKMEDQFLENSQYKAKQNKKKAAKQQHIGRKQTQARSKLRSSDISVE